MGVINLAEKYENKLDERYKQGSLTDKFCGSNYSWEGVNTIKVWTLDPGTLNDYDATATANRFGTPTEVEDEVNPYTLTKKRSFSKVFDITHTADQMFMKKSNSFLKQIWDELYVPEIDRHRLSVWANGAGLGVVNTEELNRDTVMEAILKAHAALDDASVPFENRATFIRTDIAVSCKLASELANSQTWMDKTVVKGKIAEINGSPVISVPKSIMPAGVEFMIKHKGASADPMKLRLLRANDNAPGYAGTLMEGLCRYDAFVLANKADGIFVYAQSGMTEAPVITVSGGSAAITGADGVTIFYTTDGTNPKTSETALPYSTAVPVESGTKIRAYAEKSGEIKSPIASVDAE